MKIKKTNAEYYDSDLLWGVVYMLVDLAVIQDISHTYTCLMNILRKQELKRHKDKTL